MNKQEAIDEFEGILDSMIDSQIESWRTSLSSTKESYPEVMQYHIDRYKFGTKLHIWGYLHGLLLASVTFREDEEHSIGEDGPANVKKYTLELVNDREDDIEEMIEDVVGSPDNEPNLD